MIISASYKTDIPAFFGTWFTNRLLQGYCKMVNPYNRRVIRVSLARPDVQGFVFWTKNLVPFVRHLDGVSTAGFPFIIQYTINGYPRALEQSVVDASRSIDTARQVADRFGPNVCVWRYDTIVDTSLTPFDFHRRNFESIAARMAGATNEVVISFAHFYRKTLRNMHAASALLGFSWRDPPDEEKIRLVADLVSIAGSYGMRLTVCSQPQYEVAGAGKARCVDADRFAMITGHRPSARLHGNRKECGCYESRDIGDYDTCPHGCVYCYAVQNSELAANRFRRHNPASEFLLEPDGVSEMTQSHQDIQLPLFPGG
jgi:hypothetical protein